MTARPRIRLLCNSLGLGGTEKGLALYAQGLDRARFDVAVIGIHDLGPRAEQLRAAGITVECAGGDDVRLAELVDGADVAHVFRRGVAEPLVPAACRRAGVGHLVETNIFGSVDRSPDEEQFACHLHVSQMCLLRYCRNTGESGPGFHRRNRVLPAPVGLEELRERAPAPTEARRALGLDPDRPVVGRVGRSADLKWRRLLVDMIPALVEQVPDVQMLLVGVTPATIARLRRLGILDRCVMPETSADPARVAAFYAACDVTVNASAIGESQGFAIVESMALGVPVVSCSTPWADNAQVENIDHGRTGWLAGHPQPFAEAVSDLLGDPARRSAFGAAGREFAERRFAMDVLSRRLECLYTHLLETGTPPGEWIPSADAVEAFAAEYPRRAAAEFRPLSRREQLEAAEARGRERAMRVRISLADFGLRTKLSSHGVAGFADRVSRREGGRWQRLAMRAYLGAHRTAERAGLHVVRASYDSPIPRRAELRDDDFARESPMRGIAWDTEAQLAWVERELGPYLPEFRPHADPDAPVGRFRLDNRTYDRVDAELLYGVVRAIKPNRIVELGSGYSTLVTAAALAANGVGVLDIYDPYPSAHVLARPELAARLRRVSAQDLSEDVVTGLRHGDVLFVDTSHTVKLGGDVNRILLDLLPIVPAGVAVHFHDIFLPGEYSRGHLDNAHFWTEQYLLQAFLVHNAAWEVLVGAQAIVRHDAKRVGALIESYRPGVSPGAFWLRRR